jgi:hypothetical protein
VSKIGWLVTATSAGSTVDQGAAVAVDAIAAGPHTATDVQLATLMAAPIPAARMKPIRRTTRGFRASLCPHRGGP